MTNRAMIAGAMAMALLTGAALAGAAVGPGPIRAHPGSGIPRCTPPTVPVWGRISTLGALGWHCMLPPAPNCGKKANPVWHPATSTWTCKACPAGEFAYTTPAIGGGEFTHCSAHPPKHRR
ncbi:MAG: hypothetical protein ACHP84_08265 [Caulobacterales bacterium]